MYVSEITEFLNALRKEHPELEQQQKRGRSIWWDRPAIDLDEAARLNEAKVPQQPYVYQTKL